MKDSEITTIEPQKSRQNLVLFFYSKQYKTGCAIADKVWDKIPKFSFEGSVHPCLLKFAQISNDSTIINLHQEYKNYKTGCKRNIWFHREPKSEMDVLDKLMTEHFIKPRDVSDFDYKTVKNEYLSKYSKDFGFLRASEMEDILDEVKINMYSRGLDKRLIAYGILEFIDDDFMRNLDIEDKLG